MTALILFFSVRRRIRHGTPPSHRLCQIAKCSTKVGLGFSDVSTLAVTFTSKLGWASAHCSNFMDLTPEALDSLTVTLTHIGTPTGETFSQQASAMFSVNGLILPMNPQAALIWIQNQVGNGW